MFIDQNRLDKEIKTLQKKYADNDPFPNIFIDHFLTDKCLKSICDDFPQVSDSIWTHYIHYNERKHGLTKWEHFPKSVQDLITEMGQTPFIHWLENLTGIQNLFADPDLEGSGLHQTLTGGFLNIHADFTVHPKHNNWQRRVNVLIFLNENWDNKWGGILEFWDETMQQCKKQISPVSNRVAIFSTGKKTYHGYPNPITCPEGVSRKSIAMYFYTKDDSFEKVATDYRARPNDGYKKSLIWMDTKLISVYSKLKGFLGLSDDFVSSLLNKFSKK